MSFSVIVIFTSMLIYCNVQAQRSPYAGARPASGYKDTYLPQSTSASTIGGGNTVIGNRDGESGPSVGTTSTERLPYDAHGDAAIVNHYNSLPIDQRPFWIVNQQHIEAQRGTPPSRPTQTGSTSQTITNRPDVVDRFNENGPQPFPQQQFSQAQQPQQSQQQPNNNSANNQNNVISLPEVVYPSNITPEQRLNMEIQFLQQRLEVLLERRRQLQAQNGQQSAQNGQQSAQNGQQSAQTMPNLQNSQTSNFQNV